MVRSDKLIFTLDKISLWSLYILIFCLPFSKSIIEICASICIAIFILKRVLIRDFSIPKTAAGLPLLFMFLTATISLLNSHYMDLSIRALFSKNLKFIMLYLIAVDVIDDRTKLKNLLIMAAVSAVIIFADVFVQYFVTHKDFLRNYPSFKYVLTFHLQPGRDLGSLEYFIGYPTGPFPFPNDLAAWLLIITPPAIFLSLLDLKNNSSRMMMGIFSALGIYILMLAKARSAWIGFIISSGMALFFAKRKIAILLLAVMFILALACFFRAPEDIFGLSSMRDRKEMWSVGLNIYRTHPVIGNGINTFFNEYKRLRNDEFKGQRGSYAHNCYLQMAADTGIMGLLAFLWFVSTIIISAVKFVKGAGGKFYRVFALGLVAGICGYLIHSFFDTNLYSLNLASLFWVSMGVLAATVKIGEAEA